MTANQIAYQANLETRRANRAKENELHRSNLAQEELTRQRDFSKEPVAYTLYSAANAGEELSSPINVGAKPSKIGGATMQQGIKSIFDSGRMNIAKALQRKDKQLRREREPWSW